MIRRLLPLLLVCLAGASGFAASHAVGADAAAPAPPTQLWKQFPLDDGTAATPTTPTTPAATTPSTAATPAARSTTARATSSGSVDGVDLLVWVLVALLALPIVALTVRGAVRRRHGAPDREPQRALRPSVAGQTGTLAPLAPAVGGRRRRRGVTVEDDGDDQRDVMPWNLERTQPARGVEDPERRDRFVDDQHGDEPELVDDEPDRTQDEAELAHQEPELAHDPPEVDADDEPELLADDDEPEPTQDEAELAHHEPELAHDPPEVDADDEPELLADDDEPEPTQDEAELAHHEPELAHDPPEVDADDEPELLADDDEPEPTQDEAELAHDDPEPIHDGRETDADDEPGLSEPEPSEGEPAGELLADDEPVEREAHEALEPHGTITVMDHRDRREEREQRAPMPSIDHEHPSRTGLAVATTYEIVWYRADERLTFALQPVDGRIDPGARRRSGSFVWNQDNDPPASLRTAQRAHGRLRARLLREGWTAAGRGTTWFSHRFHPPENLTEPSAEDLTQNG